MKSFNKILSTVMAVALGMVSLTGCGSEKAENKEPSVTIKPGTLTVGVSPDYPPYEKYDVNGNIVGYDIDMAKELGKNMGMEVEFKAMDFENIIVSLQAGQIDVGISAFTYDAERDVLFSDTYLTSQQLIVVSNDSDYKTIEDLTGKKIGAGSETTGAKAAEANIKDAKVTSPGDYTVMFEALKNGALDAVVCDGEVAKNYAKNGNYRIFDEALVKEENKAIIKNGNDELLKAVNSAINKYSNSDVQNKLKEKWEIQG